MHRRIDREAIRRRLYPRFQTSDPNEAAALRQAFAAVGTERSDADKKDSDKETVAKNISRQEQPRPRPKRTILGATTAAIARFLARVPKPRA